MPSFTRVATVAGVVEDMRLAGPTESAQPTVFQPIEGGFVDSFLIVRGSEPIDSLRRTASSEVAALMPGLSVMNAYSVTERVRAALDREERRACLALAGALAMVVVTCIGLYAALAYYTNTRRRELAVRSCLGAAPWTIRRMILARAGRCAALAVLLCVPLWPVLAQLSSGDYLGKASWSSARAALLSLACAFAALLISLVPATAATRIAPAEILKEE